ncbi:MAG: TonB-dependent receptor [Alphaproteobacteria bacterium]|nr:TonB-dependent receptor [Alphaproteobacteria bacterium]
MRFIVSHAAIAAALLASAPSAFAAADDSTNAEEIVVTATRAASGLPRDQLGTSVTVVQPVDMELRQTRLVSDLLRDIPGLAVSRAGTVGGFTEVRIRGAEADHTLVLIDGMEASDPFYGQFDFASLIADEVARVEVLRGQQSALYGSDAIGGVINYITLSGREAPGVRGRTEGGSFGSYAASARAAGYADGFDYAVSAGYQHTDGVPTARFGTRDIGAANAAVSGRFSYEVTENFRLRAIGRYARVKADVNDQEFDFASPTYGFVIDSDDDYTNRMLYGLVGADLSLLGGAWTHALSVQGTDARRRGYSGGAFDYGDDGSRIKGSYVTAYHFGNDRVRHTLTGAADFERETFRNRGAFLSPAQSAERSTENTGLVAQYDLLVGETIGVGVAVRYDDNNRFDDATTYRLQASFLLDSGTRLHAATGSGTKNPGIFELYGFDPANFQGNPDLKPEHSRGWEAGVAQRLLGGRIVLDVTYFSSTLTDEIYTDFSGFPISTPRNRTTESEQDGVEISMQAVIDEAWRVFASYTYLNAKEDGVEEIRRPPNVASLNLSYVDPDDRFSATVTVRCNGETFDNNFTHFGDARVRLASYTLVNLAGDARITDELRLFARVENLFDEDYEDVYTYRTAGRGAFVGLRAGF